MGRRWWSDGAAPVFARRDVPRGRAQQTDRFAALAAYARRWPPDPAEGLGAHELRVCSQNGEDGVLAEILRRLGPSGTAASSGASGASGASGPSGPSGRTFVEFGIESGEEGNCVALADFRAWTGWFFEPDADGFRSLSAKYAWNDRVRTERRTITPDEVDEQFTAAGVPATIDVLSIDVDGADAAIWRALSVTRARVVVIEYNSALDPEVALTHRSAGAGGSGWDGTQNHGSSLAAVLEVADAHGYDLVHLESAGVNAFFVDRALGWDGLRGGGVTRRTPNYFGLRAGHPGYDPSQSGFTAP